MSDRLHTDEKYKRFSIFIENWPEGSGDGHDFKILTRKYSNEMMQQSQRQTPLSSHNHDFNNLRGSMSSSTSSIQNNMVERKKKDNEFFQWFFVDFRNG